MAIVNPIVKRRITQPVYWCVWLNEHIHGILCNIIHEGCNKDCPEG